MPITDATVYRVLDFAARVCKHGHRPTREELETYASNPSRRGDFFSILSGEVFGPGVVGYVEQMGWVTFDKEDRASVGEYGLAVLDALREQDSPPPKQRVLVLRGQNGFDYAELIGALTDLGQFMLVDPFFKILAHLEDLSQSTNCARILVGDDLKSGEYTALSIALRDNPDVSIEIRRGSGKLHDRFVIPDQGAVFSLGTSLSGIGKHFSLLVQVESPLSDHIRDWHNGLWEEAQVLALGTGQPES